MDKRCIAITIIGDQCPFKAQPRSNFCGQHKAGSAGPLKTTVKMMVGRGTKKTVKKAAKKAAKKR
jgi:hypothetical protein